MSNPSSWEAKARVIGQPVYTVSPRTTIATKKDPVSKSNIKFISSVIFHTMDFFPQITKELSCCLERQTFHININHDSRLMSDIYNHQILWLKV